VSELAKRWAVAIVGVPVVILLLYVGGWVLALPLAALAALGTDEVHRIARSGSARPFDGLGQGVAAGLVLVAAWRPSLAGAAPWALALVAFLVAASLATMVLRRAHDGAPLASAAVTCFAALYVGVPLACVPLLHALPAEHAWSAAAPPTGAGLFAVALPLASTWIGDALAFFAGRAWGRAKLAPTISPKKTWVGAWAGLAGAGGAGAVWWLATRAWLPGVPLDTLLAATLVGVLLGVGAQVGDLAESLLKREAGVKDSGVVFPGHGGVLDRLDALAWTLPMAYGILLLAGARS
jgi:phosphatidate cytidylyltransferase